MIAASETTNTEAAEPRSRGRVALLVDCESLRRCIDRETPYQPPQWGALLRFAQGRGLVVAAAAYGEWMSADERSAAYAAGVDPVYSPVLRTESDRDGKSLTDTLMMVHGMDLLWTGGTDTLVLCSLFKDLVPLVHAAKQRGVRVVLIGTVLTDVVLHEMADEHVRYGTVAGVDPTLALPSTVVSVDPPKSPPRRRRTRATAVAAGEEAPTPSPF